MSSGLPRSADIQIRSINGVKWVFVERQPRGISTFDRPGVPRGRDWEYYRIPAGTVLPEGLSSVQDQFNSAFGATHYTIAPAYDMPLEQFKRLLSMLASDVIREAVRMIIPEPWLPLLVSAVRDAVLYNERLLESETLRDRADYEEHYMHLTQFFEYVKAEYRKVEEDVGMPLEQIL